jgi:iron complex outermembrane receptor protein
MNVKVEVDVASLFIEDELFVGSTVSSITPEEWKQAGARRTHEALDNEPGVVNYRTLGGSNILSIRGYTNNASVRGVSWQLDGVPLNTLTYGTAAFTVPDWSLGTLNKIEMIKGPGSALYGSDAFHGVVSLKTFENDEDFYSADVAGAYPVYYDASTRISKGINDKVRIDAAAGTAFQGDLDIDYEYEDTEGSPVFGLPPKNGTGTRKYEYESMSGMIKVNVKPSERLKLGAGFYGSHWDADEHTSVRKLAVHQRETDIMDNEADFLMGKLTMNYDFGRNITFEADAYSWESDRIQHTKVNPDTFLAAANSPIPSVNALAITDVKDTYKNGRSGVRFALKQKDNRYNLQWVFGCDYTEMKVKDTSSRLKLYPSGQEVDNYFLPVTGKAPFDGVERDIRSMFVQTKWEAVENRFFFIAGARYDSYSDFGDQLTPRTGIIYKPGEKSSIKALYGQAFRAASGNELTSASAVVLGSKDIDPEVIDVYELVYMYRDEDWKLNLNGFYSKWTDGIIQVSNPSYVPGSPAGSLESFQDIYANEGKSRSYGAEVSFSCNFDPFGLDLGLSYTKSEALDVNDPIDSTQIIDQEYDVFPEYSLKFGFFYFWDEQDVRFHLNNILYLGMKEYPSTYKTSLRSPDDLPPFWRVDLNICKKVTEKMELTLDIRNLFNRTNSMPSVWGMKDGLEEPGISFLLRVGYTF